jgi:hypothetical protein
LAYIKEKDAFCPSLLFYLLSATVSFTLYRHHLFLGPPSGSLQISERMHTECLAMALAAITECWAVSIALTFCRGEIIDGKNTRNPRGINPNSKKFWSAVGHQCKMVLHFGEDKLYLLSNLI